jgi:hypothetical protein
MFNYNMNTNRQVLTMDQIRLRAPSVFATAPHESASDRYRFIPTYEMLETLTKEGWECVQAGEHNVRKMSKKGFQKHMLRFRNPSLPKLADGEVDLLVYNSHDKTTGFKFQAGVYRFVCANGLVTGSNLVQPISVKHVGYKSEDAIEASYRVIDAVPRISQSVEEMQSIELNEDEKRHFARAALIAKVGELPEEEMRKEVNPIALLHTRRLEDQKNDLWSTFNAVQENLIKGGLRTVNAERTKRMTLRGVSSISENAKLNTALWTLAESMKQLKTA